MSNATNEMRVDVAVIGAGSAGMVAYRAARGRGARVVLIEGGDYGTTCARVGCMPSKLLIAAADAAHAVARAPAFGVDVQGVQVDGARVLERVRAERDRFVSFVLDEIAAIPAADKLRGHARFIAPQRLQVGDAVIEARAIVIATGSKPALPPILRNAGARVITSDTVFDWKHLPASLAVVGTGSVGLELGQALHRLGVRVVLYGRGDRVGGLRDPLVLNPARAVFCSELDLRLNTELVEVRPDAQGVTLVSRDANGSVRNEQFEYVLAATGRHPDLADLNLASSGLALDAKGMPACDPYTMQCTSRAGVPVFMAGDASGERELLHEASDTGRIAGENAARFPDVEPGLRRTPLAIAFGDPQTAAVGTAYPDLPQGYVCGSVSFANQGRSRVMLENRGMLRVYADGENGRLLGAEMCGPRAEHLAHLLAWAHQNRMTLDDMLKMPFYHPVVEEGLRTAVRAARKALVGGLPDTERCTLSTPGV